MLGTRLIPFVYLISKGSLLQRLYLIYAYAISLLPSISTFSKITTFSSKSSSSNVSMLSLLSFLVFRIMSFASAAFRTQKVNGVGSFQHYGFSYPSNSYIGFLNIKICPLVYICFLLFNCPSSTLVSSKLLTSYTDSSATSNTSILLSNSLTLLPYFKSADISLLFFGEIS